MHTFGSITEGGEAGLGAAEVRGEGISSSTDEIKKVRANCIVQQFFTGADVDCLETPSGESFASAWLTLHKVSYVSRFGLIMNSSYVGLRYFSSSQSCGCTVSNRVMGSSPVGDLPVSVGRKAKNVGKPKRL